MAPHATPGSGLFTAKRSCRAPPNTSGEHAEHTRHTTGGNVPVAHYAGTHHLRMERALPLNRADLHRCPGQEETQPETSTPRPHATR